MCYNRCFYEGPRIAHAHTYAPGVHHKSLIPGSGVGMVGGSLSATRAEQERSRYRDLDDSLLGGKPAGVRSRYGSLHILSYSLCGELFLLVHLALLLLA